MATSTFFDKIIISKEAAEIMAAEAEKERKPYVPEFDFYKELEDGREWLKNFHSKKSPTQKTDKNS